MNTSKRRSRVFRTLMLFVLAFQLGTAQGEPASMAALESAIRKETENPKAGGAEKRAQPLSADFMMSQLRDAIGRNDRRQVDAVLGEIIALFKSAPVRALADKLKGELRIEQAAREKDKLARVRAVLATAANAVKTARKPVDLDDAIRDLRNLSEQPQSDSPEIREELRKVQNAREFVLLWQDYLAAEAGGNSQKAQQALQSGGRIGTDLMPRSQILSLVEEISKRKSPDPVEPARQIAAKIKSLEDIPGALDVLVALEPKPGISAGDSRGLVETLRLELSRISQVYREYQAGLPTSLQIRGFDVPVPNEETFRVILPLKVQLLRAILPRALEADEKLKINPDEPIRGYLDRVAASAFEKGDLRLLVRARELRNKLDGVLLSNDNVSVSQSLIAGLNQEEAGQWAAAVISYETALKFGADVVPAKHIGERLEKIKAAHPKEFEQGYQRFMTGFQPVPSNSAPNPADKIAIPEGPVPSVPPASPR